MEQQEKKKSGNMGSKLLMQGSILAAAGIITKIIGFVYRIPMANVLGNEGNGIYSVAFGIYNIALTLSSYSLPLAVSKMVSARLATREYKNAGRVFITAMIFGIIVGMISCIFLWLGADALEVLYHRPGLALPLRILAPTTFFVALLGVFRGFFQGHGNMVPTAISQIIEQIINALVSVIAAYCLINVYSNSSKPEAYGAAGGTLGTLMGATAALLFFIWVYKFNYKKLKKRELRDCHNSESNSYLIKILVLTALPVILSQTIYQIGYTIDDFLFGNIMADKGIEDQVVSALQGVFNTQYNQLINLPVAVATAMAASTIPAIVKANIGKNKEDLHRRIMLILKFNMAIAFPSFVGLTILGEPIVGILFPRLTEYQNLSGMLLMTGSSAVIFYALSTITTAVLQGCDYMRLPVIHSGISLIIHIILVYILLKFTNIGIYALIIGNVTFPMLVSIQNCFSLRKHLGFHWDRRQIIMPQLKASIIMGIVTAVSFILIKFIIRSSILALFVSLAMSIICYGKLILRSNCFSKEEMLEIPMGTRLMRFMKG